MSENDENAPRSGLRPWMIVPLLGALGLCLTFLMQLLTGDPDRLPSTMIDKPVPDFALDPLHQGREGLSTADLTAGEGVKLVNVWASWCVPCRAEHPWIEGLAERGDLTVHGINYKDAPANAKAFLDELGDPYDRIGADTSGRVGIEWGVYGVPETYVVDADGRVVYKHIGPITATTLEQRLLPAIERAKGGSSAEGTPAG
ncbi:MAG: DsbE family thiol:disulfide interchange protein [Paracoccaceae bacterium]